MTETSSKYFRAMCENADHELLASFRKDLNSSKSLRRERVIGMCWDKSMNQSTHLATACVEHGPLLRAILEIAIDPTLKCLTQALERFGGQHGENMFDDEENSDFSSRSQAQGIKIMLAYLGKRSRNIQTGQRTTPEIMSLLRHYDQCHLAQGGSKYRHLGDAAKASRTPSRSPDCKGFQRTPSASMEDIDRVYRPSTGALSKAIAPADHSTDCVDFGEVCSSQELAKPAVDEPPKYKQWTCHATITECVESS